MIGKEHAANIKHHSHNQNWQLSQHLIQLNTVKPFKTRQMHYYFHNHYPNYCRDNCFQERSSNLMSGFKELSYKNYIEYSINHETKAVICHICLNSSRVSPRKQSSP